MASLTSLMPPTDSMFLLAESREQPMHVGGLQLFTPPEGADSDYLLDRYRAVLEQREMSSLFRRRPARSLTSLGQWAWSYDDDVDLEYHVRHSALPRPHRIRELFALVSRLHGTPLDRQRPLWEAHLIEGLADGRIAVYTKMHHALMDGISALKLLERSLSDDPHDMSTPAPWAPSGRPAPANGGSSLLGLPLSLLRAIPGAAKTSLDLAGLAPILARYAGDALREPTTAMLGQAPRTILNQPITGARRFAAQSFPMEQVRQVGKAAGATVNDVVLAMCSSALRAYLLELDALPDAPLIAMTPVSLRNDDDPGDEPGNSTGVILCNLATHLTDPGERLTAIQTSMNHGKKMLRQMSQLQAIAVGGLVLLPLALESALGGTPPTPPPYNLVISNVPGPQRPLYWNGARMDGMYPLSIPTHGQALNITIASYDGDLHFGLVGDRRAAPSLQRLVRHLERALEELLEAT